MFSCVNNVALEVFNFEKLNFSKNSVAYGVFLQLKHRRSVLTENADYIWKYNLLQNFWVKKLEEKLFPFSENPKTILKTFLGFFHKNQPYHIWSKYSIHARILKVTTLVNYDVIGWFLILAEKHYYADILLFKVEVNFFCWKRL